MGALKIVRVKYVVTETWTLKNYVMIPTPAQETAAMICARLRSIPLASTRVLLPAALPVRMGLSIRMKDVMMGI